MTELTAEEVRSRTHPKHLSIDAIRDESDELIEAYQDTGDHEITDAMGERWSMMLTVLEQRLEPDYPECPHCGAAEIGYQMYGSIVCKSCYEPLPEDVRQQYRDEYARVWNGDDSGGGEDDGE